MKKMIFTFFYLLPLLMYSGTSIAQGRHEAKPLGSTNAPYGYYQYFPEDYHSSATKMPLLIFLHGAGERGNGISELGQAVSFGPGREIEKGRDFPFIVLSPQTSGDWHPRELNAFIKYAIKNYNIDKDRVYLTGLSLGAMGILRYTAKFPDKIAALVPISGSGNTDEVCNYSHVPLWAFHGDADDVVPVSGSIAVVNVYNKCRPTPSPEAKLTLYPGVGHYAWNQTYDGSAGHDVYSWMLQYTRKGFVGSNQEPAADAGPDQSITLPENKLTLEGSATDADGSIVSYEWNKLSGPFVNIKDRKSRTLSLRDLREGTYRFRLNVKDNEGAKDHDEVLVVVHPAPEVNEKPVVDAGKDKTVTLPLKEVSLAGGASDEDGDVVAYRWKKVSGPDGLEMQGENSAELRLRKLEQASYVFALTAEDDDGATASDEVRLLVKAAPDDDGPDEASSIVASAGSDRSLSLPVDRAVLSGSARLENGAIASYEWSKVSGPSVEMRRNKSANLVLTGLQAGEYKFRFTAKATSGMSDSDEMVLTVTGGGGSVLPGEPEGAVQGLTYYYYEFNKGKFWSRLPDLQSLTPVKRGHVETFSIRAREQDDHFVFAFEGFIQIKTAGKYTFYTVSDDGSKLLINDRLVVDNDGHHPVKVMYGSVELEPGYHSIRVEYFENAGNQKLYVSYKGPGVELQELPRSLLRTTVPDGKENINARTNNKDTYLPGSELAEEILLYPNPAEREVKLRLGGLAEQQITISVLDMAGRIVCQDAFDLTGTGTELRLDLQAYELRQGSYLMLIENEKKERVKVLRFLKQ